MPSFSAEKLKTNLRLAASRMKLQAQKKQNWVANEKLLVGRLLQENKEDNARIKVSHSHAFTSRFCTLLESIAAVILLLSLVFHAVFSLSYSSPRSRSPLHLIAMLTIGILIISVTVFALHSTSSRAPFPFVLSSLSSALRASNHLHPRRPKESCVKK